MNESQSKGQQDHYTSFADSFLWQMSLSTHQQETTRHRGEQTNAEEVRLGLHMLLAQERKKDKESKHLCLRAESELGREAQGRLEAWQRCRGQWSRFRQGHLPSSRGTKQMQNFGKHGWKQSTMSIKNSRNKNAQSREDRMGLRPGQPGYGAAGAAEGRAFQQGRNLAASSFSFQEKRSLFVF